MAGSRPLTSAETLWSALSAGVAPAQRAVPPEERSEKPLELNASWVTQSKWQSSIASPSGLTVPFSVAVVLASGSGAERSRSGVGSPGA